ncbi:MAG: gamma-glutamylcyclotransferase family protein [Pseudomonadota bacterium]
MTKETERLFVYGTLAPGRANHDTLADIEGTWLAATVRGHLLDQGWGAKMGYPGIVPASDGAVVEGFVLSSSLLHTKWSMLDAFEGDAYRRESVAVTLETGEIVDAYVYALRHAD